MSTIQSYEDLIVWQKAHELVLNIYEITKNFPSCEKFGLTAQLRRSLISVPANIAEGNRRSHLKEYLQFLNIAQGSLGEGEYYLRLAKDINYISQDDFIILSKQCKEIGKMLYGLQKSLRQSNC